MPIAWMRPWSSITARSHTSTTVSSAWVTSTIVRPSAWKLRTRSRHFAWNASSPTASTSSINKHVGFDVHGHREPEPHEHARRVELHLVVHEVLELGERDDVVVDAVGVLARQAQERGVQVDVLATGELGVEPGAQLEQRRDPPALADRRRRSAAGCRRCTSAAWSCPSRCARSARATSPPRRRTRCRGAPRSPRPRMRPEQHALLERARPLAEEAEDLRDVLDLERGGHSSSAKSPESRKNSRHVRGAAASERRARRR